MIFILTSNAVVYTTCANAIYVDDRGYLCVDTPSGIMYVGGIPEDALQQIAVAEADGKRYVEFEDAHLVLDEGEVE